jgi:hypothetical protein
MAIPWTECDMDKNLLDLSSYVEDPNHIAPKTNFLKPLGPSLWIIQGDEVHKNRRMVICGLQGGGGAWLWSPMLPPSGELCDEIEGRCGGVRHIVCPSMYHYDYLAQWSRRYPKAKVHVAPPGLGDGLPEETSSVVVDFVISDDPKRDYVLDMDSVLMRGSSTTEAIFYHRLSHTLIVADLIQEQSSSWSAWLWGSSNNSKSKSDSRPIETEDADPTSSTKSDENVTNDDTVETKDDTVETKDETVETKDDTVETKDDTVEQPPPPPEPSDSALSKDNDNNDDIVLLDESVVKRYYVPKTWQFSFWWNNELQVTRNALEIILKKWKPQQLILSRGTCLPNGATQVIQHAFHWVPRDNYMMYTDAPAREALGSWKSGVFTTGDRLNVEEEAKEQPEPVTNAVIGPTTKTGMPLPIIPKS